MKTSKISYKAAISSKKLDAFFDTEAKQEEEQSLFAGFIEKLI